MLSSVRYLVAASVAVFAVVLVSLPAPLHVMFPALAPFIAPSTPTGALFGAIAGVGHRLTLAGRVLVSGDAALSASSGTAAGDQVVTADDFYKSHLVLSDTALNDVLFQLEDRAAADMDAKPGMIYNLWVTVLFRMNIAHFLRQARERRVPLPSPLSTFAGATEHAPMHMLNAALHSAISAEHAAWRAANDEALSHKALSGNDVNDHFYQWQTSPEAGDSLRIGGTNAATAATSTTTSTSGFARAFAHRPAFKALRQYIGRAVTHFLRHIGQAHHVVENHAYDFSDMWVTVHTNHTSHPRHTHPGTLLLSGVYYVSTPDDAGNIYFEDPRGPRHPFADKQQLTPAAGELLLFPSWLVHQVAQTPSEQQRISIAFNIPGDMDALARVTQQADAPYRG